MFETIKNIFVKKELKELRDRILFTALILMLERIGTFIVTPGINTENLAAAMQNQAGLGQLYNLFTGGAFSNAAIFSCGIMPYISASIIIQLMGTTVPYFQRLQKEGEDGRRKITQLTRYGTLAIAAVQASGIAIYLNGLTVPGTNAPVADGGLDFIILTVITMSAGTLLIMWMGEQITDRGVGNGISLIIFVGIIATLPSAIQIELGNITGNQQQVVYEFVAIILILFIIVSIVALTQGVRKIPIQYAKRVVGKKVYGGSSAFFPVKVNAAGVMPIIFAQAFMFLPETVFKLFPENDLLQSAVPYFSYEHWFYWFLTFLLIIFFTYFYTAISVNPVDIADNLKKQNGFIPGIRPGPSTAEYLDGVVTRLTLPGSIYLGLISVVPYFLVETLNLTFMYANFFGGTGILIIVGVALDTLQQVESHLAMKNYDGFLQSGRIRGRRA